MSEDGLGEWLGLHSRLPSEKPFVSLSHAVSWIALRRSSAGPVLSKLLGLGKKQCDERIDENERLDRAIKSAVERLTDLGLGGKIEILGRKYAHVLVDDSDDKIPTERIPALRMADYRGFDTLDDTLFLAPYREVKLAWCRDRLEICSPLGEHFRFVMVNRADLMREFPAETGPHDTFEIAVGSQPQTLARAPAVKNGRPPSDGVIQAKADEMKERGLSGHEIAATMRLETDFENAGTVLVRDLIKGRYLAGRPKKPAQ